MSPYTLHIILRIAVVLLCCNVGFAAFLVGVGEFFDWFALITFQYWPTELGWLPLIGFWGMVAAWVAAAYGYVCVSHQRELDRRAAIEGTVRAEAEEHYQSNRR